MKTIYKISLVFLLFILVKNTFAQVGINSTGAAPDAKAMLDISSTSKGFLWPRMTLAQRNAISSAPGVTPEGLTVFDTDTKNLWVWKNSAWAPYLQSPWDVNGEHIFNINSGSVGIGGMPNTTYKFDVKGQFRVGNAASTKTMNYNPLTVNDLYFNGGDAYITTAAVNSNLILQQWADTKLALGSITPTQKLDIDGQIRIRGGSPVIGRVLTTSADGTASWQDVPNPASDRRLKKNIIPIKYGLKEVLQFIPVNYQMKSTEIKQVGFIAQDVQKIVPELVTGIEGDLSKGENLAIAYGNMTAILTKAIQEQQLMIEELKKEIAILKNLK